MEITKSMSYHKMKTCLLMISDMPKNRQIHDEYKDPNLFLDFRHFGTSLAWAHTYPIELKESEKFYDTPNVQIGMQASCDG